MGIKNNPFGVGYSGEFAFEKKRICDCCRVEFLWKGTKEALVGPSICRLCEAHSVETPEQELRKLRDHETALVAAVEVARRMTRETKQENSYLLDENKEARRQVAAALQNRDRYRRVVDTLRQTHLLDKGKCTCGQNDCDVLEALDACGQAADYWYRWPHGGSAGGARAPRPRTSP